jgi:predicted RNA binding protein YcfA (HicA-like mRNA interferase family)
VSAEVTRRHLERWLLANGFTLKPGKKTSHRQFQGHGVTITVPGHGPPDLTKKHVGMIVRKLEQAGFDRATVLDSMRGQSI